MHKSWRTDAQVHAFNQPSHDAYHSCHNYVGITLQWSPLLGMDSLVPSVLMMAS